MGLISRVSSRTYRCKTMPLSTRSNSSESIAVTRITPREHMNSPIEFYVRMKGVPYCCTEEDVKDFLANPDGLIEILMQVLPNGRRTGNVFLKFNNAKIAEKVLGMDRETWPNTSRYIEILTAKSWELDEVRDMMKMNKKNPTWDGIIKISGLSDDYETEKLKELFEGVTLVKNFHDVILDENCKCDGTAFVQVKTYEDAQTALSKNDSVLKDGSIIKVEKSSNTEYRKSLIQNQKNLFKQKCKKEGIDP